MGASWLEEYQFLKTFPGYTHDTYVDEDPDVVSWLMSIHELYAKRERRAQEAANRQRG